jgi:hypothetical protein
VALSIYTPSDEIGIVENQHVTNKTMRFMHQKWRYSGNLLCIYAPILIFGHRFHRFWCNPRRILAFYTPYDKIGPELNQYVIKDKMSFIHQKWCGSSLAVWSFLSVNY